VVAEPPSRTTPLLAPDPSPEALDPPPLLGSSRSGAASVVAAHASAINDPAVTMSEPAVRSIRFRMLEKLQDECREKIRAVRNFQTLARLRRRTRARDGPSLFSRSSTVHASAGHSRTRVASFPTRRSSAPRVTDGAIVAS
jgi:hypothetical protein